MNKLYQHSRKVLVIRTDRVGDVVLTTPALRALREAFPRAHIAVLVTPQTRDLVEGIEIIDEVLVDDKKGRHAGLSGFMRLVWELKLGHFDLVLNLHTKKRTNALCFLAGIPERVGYVNDKFGFLLNKRVKDIRPRGLKHERDYCLDIVRSLGVDVNGPAGLQVARHSGAELWADEFWRRHRLSRPVVAVHADASDAAKRWPAERFGALIVALQKRYRARVVLVGGPGAMAVSEDVKANSPEDVIDITGQTTLAQLVSLLKRVDLLVSNDSGPVHVAAALNTPVISIFLRNQPGINPDRWRPLGPRSRIVTNPDHLAVQVDKHSRVVSGSPGAVSAQDVLAIVDGIFNLC